MSNEANTELERAAHAAAEAGVGIEEFMKAAWAAYVDARPGLREELERAAEVAQLAEWRRRGLVASA